MKDYKIAHLLPADEKGLEQGIYLVLLNALKTPPHLLLMVQGKIFTLGNKGATVDGELQPLLTLIKRKKLETVFIKLALPPLVTTKQLTDIIRKCTLHYPQVNAGTITCLAPIRDFCESVYHVEKKKINLVFDLLASLHQHNFISGSFHLNLQRHLSHDSLIIKRYTVNDVYEAIREHNLTI